MAHKIFTFDKLQVFFKHTDYYGFVHPYNYLEWSSYAREAFFQESLADFRKIISRPVKMMTVKIRMKVLKDLMFGDTICACLTVGKIKKVSFEINVDFICGSTEERVCRTSHSVVFLDLKKGSFAPIPIEMDKIIVQYQKGESGDF